MQEVLCEVILGRLATPFRFLISFVKLMAAMSISKHASDFSGTFLKSAPALLTSVLAIIVLLINFGIVSSNILTKVLEYVKALGR
jgi:hypothetical protein